MHVFNDSMSGNKHIYHITIEAVLNKTTPNKQKASSLYGVVNLPSTAPNTSAGHELVIKASIELCFMNESACIYMDM